MATVRTSWFQIIILTGWCISFKGASLPSPPECHRPCNDRSCSANIICTWNPMPGPKNNLTYTLHWEGYLRKGTGHRAIILRDQFSDHSELTVWVQSKDQDGTVSKSETVTFNTGNILKPSPPRITFQKPIEIHWHPSCDDQLRLEVGHCDVRHRTEAQSAWIQEEEGGLSGSYSLNSPEPCMDYFFQVRCICVISLMSDWSEVHTVKPLERAPIGIVDVWRDCGMLIKSSECFLTWKKLPMSKACGHILGYTLSLYFNNGTDILVNLNESVAASVHLVCSDVQCYYNSSLKDVQSVRMNAFNAHGVSAYSHLDMHVPVKLPQEEAIILEMSENTLTVSWNMKSWTSDIKGYVVQYKEDGSSLGQGLDWIRLNASLTKVTINGQFKKFTAYQVSVFALLEHNKVQLHCTGFAHYVQGRPSKVPLFEVISYDTVHATLLWETVLMSVQKGVTPYYQIGYGKENIYNESAYPQLEKRNITLENLEENHDYLVWIKAVNEAGPGPKTSVRFQTLSSEHTGVIVKIFVGFGAVAAGLIILFALFCCRENKACPVALSSFYETVPDPHKSNIIRELKNQINDPWTFLRTHPKECHELSEIEIIKTTPFTFTPQTEKINSREDSDDPPEDILPEHKKEHYGCGKQEYSKMVDSDDENNEVDETQRSSWSSEEDNTGYEQHFMPTELDIQAIEEQEKTENGSEE